MLSTPLRQAIFLMIFATSLVPLGDTAGKLLTADGTSQFFIAWSRFALGALVLLPFMGLKLTEFRLLTDWRVWLRAGFIMGGITSILTALKTLPISDAFAVFFIGPILSYFLSWILLKEQITLPRTLLLLLGFIGVLLVVKPGMGMKPGIGYAFLAGCSYGLYLVTNRWLSDIARPRMLLMSQLIIGSIVLAPFGAGSIPDLTDYWADFLILVSALGSAFGNLFLLMAYRRAEATILAPLIYLQLVASTVFGFAVFGDVPDLVSFAGLTLLISSGFASFWFSRPKKR